MDLGETLRLVFLRWRYYYADVDKFRRSTSSEWATLS